MKISRLLSRITGKELRPLWPVVAALAVVLSILWFLGLPTSAAGPTSAGEPAMQVLTHPLQSIEPTPASPTHGDRVGPDLEAGNNVTIFLPFVFEDYWVAPDSLLGVQIFWSDEEAEMRMAQMGTKWVRLPISWAPVEPTNTEPISYHWSVGLDKRLARLSASNIQVILTLSGNPSWAATWPGGPIDQPGASNSDLAEFLVAAVERYGQPPYNVKHWEFYNEPDNGQEFYAEQGWGYFGNEPEAYAQLLEAVYQPIKTADPEAQIVFGGMAYDWWTSEGGPFVEQFLDGVLQAPGGNSFDVMNFHYYPAFRNHWAPYGPDIIGKTNYIRNKLSSYGVDRPLICTEASMWSDEAHGGSDELQSRYVSQLFARSMAADLRIVIWFMLNDVGGVGSWDYGLLNPDLSPKPSYDAYSTFARQVAFADYVRTLGPAETGSNQIEAYEFLIPGRPTSIVVAWTNDEQQHGMWLPADRVVIVDKFGLAQAPVEDGDDGLVDGRVWVTLGPSPLYLRY